MNQKNQKAKPQILVKNILKHQNALKAERLNLTELLHTPVQDVSISNINQIAKIWKKPKHQIIELLINNYIK